MSAAMLAAGSSASPGHHLNHGASSLDERAQLRESEEAPSLENGSGGAAQQSGSPQSTMKGDNGPLVGQTESSARVVARTVDGPSFEAGLNRILVAVAQTGSCSWLPWAELQIPTPHVEGSGELSTAPSQRNGHASAYDQTDEVASSNHPKELTSTSDDHKPDTTKSERAMKHLHYPNGISRGCRKRPLFLTRSSDSVRNGSECAIAQESSGTCALNDAEIPGTDTETDPKGDSSIRCESDSADGRPPIDHDGHCEVTLKKQRLPDFESIANAPRPSLVPRKLSDNGYDDTEISSVFSCQRTAFRVAICMVLDHFYTRKGYKLNSVEKQKYTQSQAKNTLAEHGQTRQGGISDRESNLNERHGFSHEIAVSPFEKPEETSAEQNAYFQRRERLLKLLESSDADVESVDAPFTLQRVAEVLLAPGRYYAQTHKICNSLEKLLLVTASESEFGRDFRGESADGWMELHEMTDATEEHERFHLELRKQRFQKRSSSYSETDKDISIDDCATKAYEKDVISAHIEGTRDIFLEAAARASLRTKFDHVGMDVHSVAIASRDTHAIVEARGINNSPPPPNCSITATMTGLSLPGHGQLMRHKDGEHLHASTRASPPVLHDPDADRHSSLPLSALHANTSLQLLQLHHAAALAGVSPLDVLNLQEGNPSVAATLATIGAAGRDADTESRSSCSSDIDIDSESDMSFDDSASDRSDGSDSGHVDSMSAGRAMAMNRLQHQQRLQSRMLVSLNQSNSANHTQGNAPRSDAEVHGRDTENDGLASPRAVDTAWSDSSSPDNGQ